MFPKQAVGSIVGLGGMAGAVGAMLILKITGYVLTKTGSFTSLFIIAGLGLFDLNRRNSSTRAATGARANQNVIESSVDA